MQRERLNWVALEQVKKAFQKGAFVPMPGGRQAEPVAGASDMTAGLASGGVGGGDPAAMGGMPPGGDPSMGGMPPGGDPSMGGMPPGGDPSMGGMPPGGDPAAMGGMPPGGMPPGGDPNGGMSPGGDPAAMGMDPSMMAPPSGQVTMSVAELIQLIQVLKGGGGDAKGPGDGAAKKASKPDVAGLLQGLHAKMDALSGGAPAPTAPPAQ